MDGSERNVEWLETISRPDIPIGGSGKMIRNEVARYIPPPWVDWSRFDANAVSRGTRDLARGRFVNKAGSFSMKKHGGDETGRVRAPL